MRTATYRFTGKPCKRGHIGPRYSNGNCVQCQLEREAAKQSDPVFAADKRQRSNQRYQRNPDGKQNQMRDLRAAHPERHRKYAAESYRRNREQRLADRRAYVEKNRDKCKEADRAYQERNRVRRAKNGKLWRDANPRDPAATRAYLAEHYRRNKARYALKRVARRSLVRQATPAWADLHAILGFYQDAERLTVRNGIPMSVDHAIPLKACVRGFGHIACGLHVQTNLRVITLAENKALNAYGWADEMRDQLLIFVGAEE